MRYSVAVIIRGQEELSFETHHVDEDINDWAMNPLDKFTEDIKQIVMIYQYLLSYENTGR